MTCGEIGVAPISGPTGIIVEGSFSRFQAGRGNYFDAVVPFALAGLGHGFSKIPDIILSKFTDAGTVASKNTPLYRAVKADELADIQKTGKFINPAGIESKYFSTTKKGAEQYGDMAQKAFKDGPYSVVETSILNLVAS